MDLLYCSTHDVALLYCSVYAFSYSADAYSNTNHYTHNQHALAIC